MTNLKTKNIIHYDNFDGKIKIGDKVIVIDTYSWHRTHRIGRVIRFTEYYVECRVMHRPATQLSTIKQKAIYYTILKKPENLIVIDSDKVENLWKSI